LLVHRLIMELRLGATLDEKDVEVALLAPEGSKNAMWVPFVEAT
jgi:hypothetical protein